MDIQYSRGENNSKLRPPMVRFERKARFDTRLTQKNGRSSYVDEDVVHVTSPGGGVTLTKNVEQWFGEIANKPEYMAWAPQFRNMYDNWVKSRDVAKIDGTPLANWPLLSPGQVQTFLDAGVESIQQMAKLPDDRADELNARYVRSQARYWLNAAEDIGAVTAKVASLEAENKTLHAQVEELGRKFSEAKAENERLTQHVTGKDGWDVMAGRAQPAPLQIVQDTHQAPRGDDSSPPPATTPEMPSWPKQMTFDQAKELSMTELREVCYESDVKPNPAKMETLKRLVEVGALSDVPDNPFPDDSE